MTTQAQEKATVVRVSKEQLKGLTVPIDKTDPRKMFHAIHLRADGVLESTNGKVLVQLKPEEPINGVEALISIDDAKTIARNVKKGDFIEIDAAATNGTVPVSVLGNPVTAVANQNWGCYPDTEKVIPQKKRVEYAVRFDVYRLKELCDALVHMIPETHDRHGKECVAEFRLRKNGPCTMETDDGRVLGLVMPLVSSND